MWIVIDPNVLNSAAVTTGVSAQLVDRWLSEPFRDRGLSHVADRTTAGLAAAPPAPRASAPSPRWTTFQRDLAHERTQAGLTAARAHANGRSGGRPPLLTDQQVALARHMHIAGSPVATIVATLGVSPATIYRRLQTTPE